MNRNSTKTCDVKIGMPVYEIRQTGLSISSGRIIDNSVTTLKKLEDSIYDKHTLYVRQKAFMPSDSKRMGKTVFLTSDAAEHFINDRKEICAAKAQYHRKG